MKQVQATLKTLETHPLPNIRTRNNLYATGFLTSQVRN